jgi:sterol 3beta-glucosyltransferase
MASPMRVVVVASGSRGEVQPYCAIALDLKARGLQVAVATEERMKGLVEEFGLEYRFIGGDPTGLLWEPKAQEALKTSSMMKLITLTKEWDAKFNKLDILNSYVTACQGADIIVAGQLTLMQTFSASEYLKCAWVPVILGPTVPTSEFPLWIMQSLACCRCMNKFTYSIAFRLLWWGEKAMINDWRTRNLGLPPVTNSRGLAGILDDIKPPTIIACSPLICGPFGRVPADYPSNVSLKGFVFVPPSDESVVDQKLVQFVRGESPEGAKDDRPIAYLGFGSMPAPHPTDLIQVAVETCELAGCRAVLVAGWSQLDSPSCQSLMEASVSAGTLFIAKSAPHDWLFPKMSCIVHHCGVSRYEIYVRQDQQSLFCISQLGTMAAALRSGVPQVPCPVMLDQPHNAQTVLRLGCTAGILPFGNLNARWLSRLIRASLAEDAAGTRIRRSAQTCGKQVSREGKVALEEYCTIIESYGAEFTSRKQSAVSRRNIGKPSESLL